MIKWLGNSGFSINTSYKTIAIDPYQVKDCKLADIILITHPHYDHLSIDDIDKIKKPSTVFITEAKSEKKLSGDVRIVKPGEKITIDGIRIDAVPAYNINKDYHPRNNDWLGFIVNADGISIYHAGDTDLIPEMDTLSVDIAILPVSGTYLMNADEAIRAATKIKPKIAIPMHYDPNKTRHWKIFPGVGTKEDEIKFKNGLEGICTVAVLTE